jgi:hypothetical protein
MLIYVFCRCPKNRHSVCLSRLCSSTICVTYSSLASMCCICDSINCIGWLRFDDDGRTICIDWICRITFLIYLHTFTISASKHICSHRNGFWRCLLQNFHYKWSSLSSICFSARWASCLMCNLLFKWLSCFARINFSTISLWSKHLNENWLLVVTFSNFKILLF